MNRTELMNEGECRYGSAKREMENDGEDYRRPLRAKIEKNGNDFTLNVEMDDGKREFHVGFKTEIEAKQYLQSHFKRPVENSTE